MNSAFKPAIYANKCRRSIILFIASLIAPWLALSVHFLYVDGQIGRVWYLAITTLSLTAMIAARLPSSSWDDIRSLEYLYRRRRFCVTAIPLAATAYAVLSTVGAISLYLYFFWPPSTVVRLVDVSNNTVVWIIVYKAAARNGTMYLQAQVFDRYLQSPLSWPFYAFTLVGVINTVVSALLLAYWRSLGGMNDAVARSMELYERGRRLLA